jgi:hypothetical protein
VDDPSDEDQSLKAGASTWWLAEHPARVYISRIFTSVSERIAKWSGIEGSLDKEHPIPRSEALDSMRRRIVDE